MGFLRRRRLPDRFAGNLAAFRAVEREVQQATSVLSKAAPTTRLPGVPLAEVLAEFEDHLARAATGMDAWRIPELEDEWCSCADGIGNAHARAERVRLEASPPPGFEALIGLLDGLSAPLEVFEDAERAFRALRD